MLIFVPVTVTLALDLALALALTLTLTLTLTLISQRRGRCSNYLSLTCRLFHRRR